MNTTTSYWIREADDPNVAAMKMLDVQSFKPFDDLWDAQTVVVVGLPYTDLKLRIPVTDDFAERYDVVKRVSAPKPSDDAQSYVVTFVNRDYVTPGGRHPEHEVELWLTEPLDDVADLPELAWQAAEVWPESGWETGDMPWWASRVTFPDGHTVKLDGSEVQ